MRTNPKTGALVIPKIAWTCLGAQSTEISEKLASLIEAQKSPKELRAAISELVREYADKADQYDACAKAIRKGRPRTKQTTTSNKIVAAMLNVPYAARRRPGRPPKPKP